MPANRHSATAQRMLFLDRIGHDTPFYRLFDHLPEISFFAKDENFQLMCASQRFLERFGFKDETEVVGKKDAEIQEVAQAHGFCSQSAFTQLFQKYVGLTPLKYQKRFQLKQSKRHSV